MKTYMGFVNFWTLDAISDTEISGCLNLSKSSPCRVVVIVRVVDIEVIMVALSFVFLFFYFVNMSSTLMYK